MAVDEITAQEAGVSVGSPPRENLVRAITPGFELREASDPGGMPTMVGHFAVFNEWTEIHSVSEGHFMERIAPGAFTKTFAENRQRMRVLFQHGKDPQVGNKVLGPITKLEEDRKGAAFEVPLLDTAYNRELLPGLEQNLYGSSFRFTVMQEEFVQRPKRSNGNPDGLPERTVTEARVPEFGPVTFPAYVGATAGVRSLTDEFLTAQLASDPDRLRELIAATTPVSGEPEPSEATTSRQEPEPPAATTPTEPEPSEATTPPQEKTEREVIRLTPGTPAAEAREADTTEETTSMSTIEEVIARQNEIRARQKEIYAEHGTDLLDDDTQTEWDTLRDELDRGERRIKQDKEMRREIERSAGSDQNTERDGRDDLPVSRAGGNRLPADIYDVAAYRNHARNADEQKQLMREGAKRALETAVFPHARADREEAQEKIDRILERDQEHGELAQRMLHTGSATYHRAFAKYLSGTARSQEEERALSLTASAGGYAVPYTLDPTIMPTSNGSVNPLRQIARVETITGNEWRGISSAGITASYAAEAAEAGDNAPTLAQPTANVEKAIAFVPFSIEVGQDWGSLQTEMARLLQDAKDDLEATKFISGLGHSSQEPEGLLVGATAVVTTAGTAAFAVGDLYALEEALPPRFRPRASIIGNRAWFNKVRGLDTSGGAALWVRLGEGLPAELIGYPAYEESAYSSAIATGSSVLTIGDFSRFLIVDRVGLNIEVIPHLFATANNRPSGQRGLYAYWRNTTDVNTWQAFRTLKVL